MAAGEDPSDEALIVRIVSGDRDAFAALYRRHRADVYRFAMHISGSPPVADDVTQDVFMAVIHERACYEAGRSSVRAWLLGMARNHVKRARARRVDCSLDDVSSAAAFSVDADLPEVARRQDLIALRRALVQLPVNFLERQ